MKIKHRSITVKLLILAMGIVLAVTLLGCNDPIVADMEAEHRRLGVIAKQDLRQNLSNSPTASQAIVLYPAP